MCETYESWFYIYTTRIECDALAEKMSGALPAVLGGEYSEITSLAANDAGPSDCKE